MFRVEVSFHIIILGLIQGPTFNTLNYIQHTLRYTEWIHHKKSSINTVLTVTQKWAIYYKLVGGRRGSHPSAFWRETSWGESRWDGEKWPFIFDGSKREGELTVIQTAFRADRRLRISHAGSECGALGGQWPLPTGPPEKRLSKKRDTLHLNDVWLTLRVKCSLHASVQFHLSLITENTCLHWFRYQHGSSCRCKGTSFPLIWIHSDGNTWIIFGSTFSPASATKWHAWLASQ